MRKIIASVCFLLLVFIGYFLINDILENGKFSGKNISEKESYLLKLVNSDNPVPDNLDLKFVELKNGEKVTDTIYPDLQKMFDDMREVGLYPSVDSGYRSKEFQQELFNEGVERRILDGKSVEEAKEDTAKSIAVPGTSEHQLGLAVDINSEHGDNKDIYDWLKKNAYKYGFILRYPYGKTNITGIFYEPWHYRYVGKKHSKEIYNRGITLEEYLKGFEK